jgi:hypothetical protein
MYCNAHNCKLNFLAHLFQSFVYYFQLFCWQYNGFRLPPRRHASEFKYLKSKCGFVEQVAIGAEIIIALVNLLATKQLQVVGVTPWGRTPGLIFTPRVPIVI